MSGDSSSWQSRHCFDSSHSYEVEWTEMMMQLFL